ncbi:MAG: hypothetical protein KJ950_13630 [Proteobacteria bacterium]|nr:hypothetical protein [Pseudomonadota bacterium]MBU1686050.1 hypothetical protein [Pseudomonadota bacterium]
MHTNPKTIFYLLEQKGLFATGDTAPDTRLFSRETRRWVKEIDGDSLKRKYRIVRNQIFEFLDIRSFAEINTLLGNGTKRTRIHERANLLLGNMFGIRGTSGEIASKIKEYSRTADGVIRYLKGKILANYAPYIEMTNEIDMLTSPVELLLIMFDDRYHKKARFEAKRKLILMSLAGAIDQRERETDVENKFAGFLDFLNEHVWSNDFKIGELKLVYLLSEHDRENFSCRSVSVVTPAEKEHLKKRPGQKITLIKRRSFRINGKEVPIYVSIRKKPPEAKVLKLLRKGEENPAVAVDDELGLMAVLESLPDVNYFQQHLTRCAIKAGSFMTLEDVSDTLNGGQHSSRSAGSNANTPMFKFFARMGGMRVEFIVHTHTSYLNYIYQRGTSHDEYEVKRIFESGVAELLFPEDIYQLDLKTIQNQLIGWFRKNIEEF